jgi:hypothetical protein
MPYQLACIGDVFLLKWGDEITGEDIGSLEKDIFSTREKVGVQLVFVGIVSEKSGVPSAAARSAMTAGMSKMAKICREMHVVIEGDGFGAAARRTITAGMGLVSGQKLKVHSSLEDALSSAQVSAEATSIAQRAYGRFN